VLRVCAAALALAAATAQGAPAEAAATAPAPLDGGAPMGFRLEGKPAVDDVFGDASDYRRTIDRFLELTSQMQEMRDGFAKSVQATLAELPKTESGKKRICPTDAVAAPYARAQKLGAEYLRVGRELTRHYEQVKEFDRLGESIGLTPDYRWKVRRVLSQFGVLLNDFREMKVAFHDQLNDELKFAGCDLNALLLKGDPGGRAELSWPQPGMPGAPGVLIVKAAPPVVPSSPPSNDPRETVPPPTLPPERVPPPQPIPLPSQQKKATAPADRDALPRSGILFYVDNSKCQRGTIVWLDGKKVGEVPAAMRVGFQTSAGPHDLCLLDDAKKSCGAPGTVRKSYLHEGWTISLRCE
jgi:hypothetical protein